jgi:hypothetical protein
MEMLKYRFLLGAVAFSLAFAVLALPAPAEAQGAACGYCQDFFDTGEEEWYHDFRFSGALFYGSPQTTVAHASWTSGRVMLEQQR